MSLKKSFIFFVYSVIFFLFTPISVLVADENQLNSTPPITADILPDAERNALIAFYTGTNGDNWVCNTNWKTSDGSSFSPPGTEGTWHGITVENGHVTIIWLRNNGLTGSLPPEIGNLSELRVLDLSEDEMRRVNDRKNSFFTSIPPEIGNLKKLETCIMFNCDFTGPIPPQIGNCTSLKTLNLNINNFSGGIPAQLANLANLDSLSLNSCHLTGSIPVELGNLSVLKQLTLSVNDLSGGIPIQLANLGQLQFLYLNDNPNLGGSIPPQLGNLSHLINLNLSNTGLTGSLPTELGNLSQLQALSLSNNSLTGSILPVLGNLNLLWVLDLSRNNISGSIPAQLGNLPNLRTLNLRYNSLSGSIPPDLGNCPSLRYLHLNSNRLTGEVPIVLANIASNISINVNCNANYSENSAIRDILLRSSPGWEGLQTIAPGSLTVAYISSTSVAISWTPILYQSGTGRTLVYVGTAPGGPYTLMGSTADKAASSFTLDGLTPGTTYYVVTKSQTDPIPYDSVNFPINFNNNTVTSDYSQEISFIMMMPTLTLTSPNGGETWDGCSTHTITWTSSGPVGTISLEYSTTGTSGSFIPIASSISNTGSYSWQLPDVDSTMCVVRIQATANGLSDSSNNVFTIQPCPSITITSPNGGEILQKGLPITITWDHQRVAGDVSLVLYSDNGLIYSMGAANVASNTYTRTLPLNIEVRSDYFIRLAINSLSDDSDAFFSIINNKSYADFNNDGKTDILWRYYSPNGGWNMVWTMDGTTKTSTINLPGITDIKWFADGTGDFNNDGKTDILWRYYSPNGGWNMVWLMDGVNKSSTVNLKRLADINWKIEGLGDFNNDGQIDILWRYYGSNGGWNMVWYMNGTTCIGSTYLDRIADLNWKADAVADFNLDGKPDILWRYYGTNGGWNMVWLMNGVTKIETAQLPRVPDINWKIEGVGYFDNDVSPDILWRYYGTGGWNMIWFMDTINRSTTADITAVPDKNWKIEN